MKRLLWLTVFTLVFCASLGSSGLFVFAAAEDEPTPPRGTVSYNPGGVILKGPEDAECAPDIEGALRYSPRHRALLLCDGTQWVRVQTAPLSGAENGK